MTLTPDNLDRHLADLTAPPADPPGLWLRALDRAEAEPRRPGLFHRMAVQPLPNSTVAAVVLILVLGFVAVFMLPALGGARQSARRLVESMPPAPAAPPVASQPLAASAPAAPNASGRAQTEDAPGRAVIRKATIELAVDDVRAAFSKAALVISEARGEYVESSSLTGEGPRTQGQLTLRVAAARLSAVLDELRQLGTVRAEKSGGEDVTAQVVDLDARLRNEQRVEAELLELLEKRADAPLEDLLRLRESLNTVRQAIERLTGERERLGRLVDLATVLVIIRPVDGEPAAAVPLSDYFTKNIAAAWRSGLRFLADTVANLLAVLVGGLIWWVLAIVAIIAVARLRRRALARGV